MSPNAIRPGKGRRDVPVNANGAPYWWEAAPLCATPRAHLDLSYDVAVVGSGYTGLRAALGLLRGGRSVVVFESHQPGYGASRRNAGFLGRVLKKSYPRLLASAGKTRAIEVYRELDEAYQSTVSFIEDEQIECFVNRCGRFIGATSPAHYEELAQELTVMKSDLEFDFHMVPRSEQSAEIGTDVYFGGAVIPELGSLHPGLYHLGLLQRVQQAGGIVVGECPVTRMIKSGPDHVVYTTRGETRVRNVVIATNGYTPRSLKWHSKRVIPFHGYMAATTVIDAQHLR